MRGVSVFRLAALGALGLACGAAPEPEAVSGTSRAFSNQYGGGNARGNHCKTLNCLPIHEEITVDALHFLKEDVRNYLAKTNANFDFVNVPNSLAHFDECHFRATTEMIRNNYVVAVNAALSFPEISGCGGALGYKNLGCSETGPSESLDSFAKLLHPIQDFYAHTNWVEFGQSGIAFPANVPGLPEFPLLTPYTTIRGMRIVDGEPPPGWTVRTPPKDASYPASVQVTVKMPGAGVEPALISGRTGTDPFHPNNCPKFIGPGSKSIDHDDDLAKDMPNTTRMFPQARLLAKTQTTHEWCRFQDLVYKEHGAEGVEFLCQNWVEDRAAASAACPALRDEARCSLCPNSAPPVAGTIRPGETQQVALADCVQTSVYFPNHQDVWSLAQSPQTGWISGTSTARNMVEGWTLCAFNVDHDVTNIQLGFQGGLVTIDPQEAALWASGGGLGLQLFEGCESTADATTWGDYGTPVFGHYYATRPDWNRLLSSESWTIALSSGTRRVTLGILLEDAWEALPVSVDVAGFTLTGQ